MEATIESVKRDRDEFIEVLNASDMSQDESDTLLGILDNVISSYEREQSAGVGQLRRYIKVKDEALTEIREIAPASSFRLTQLAINALKINGKA